MDASRPPSREYYEHSNKRGDALGIVLGAIGGALAALLLIAILFWTVLQVLG